MKTWLSVISTPTADTPGTSFYLHTDTNRYLIGQVAEGTTRSCLEEGVSLRKVSNIFVTGRARWANLGGLFGMMLQIADIKKGSGEKLRVTGPPNLDYILSTARRFIFRTGTPVATQEVKAVTTIEGEISVQAIPLTSSSSSTPSSPRSSTSRSTPTASPTASTTTSTILHQMFNSDWKYDNLVEKPLSQVRHPAKCYIRENGVLKKYKGPLTGDRKVWVREMWPAVAVEHLIPTKTSTESICYVFRMPARRGKFLPAKARELGVPRGPAWAQLTNGVAYEGVTPEMVMSPGRAGRVVAVLDVPTREYIPALLEVDVSADIFIWMLGAGVGADERINAFQQQHHAQHFVSSPDYADNDIALHAAAASAEMHHSVDEECFPLLRSCKSEGVMHLPQSRILKKQRLIIDPEFEIEPPVEWNDNHDHNQTDKEENEVEILTLGTGSSQPGTIRNVSGTLVRIPGWGSILFDCGEGTYNTLKRMMSPEELKETLASLKLVWISHLHADHHLGLTSILLHRNKLKAKKLTVVSHEAMLGWLHEYSSAEELDLANISTLAAVPGHETVLEFIPAQGGSPKSLPALDFSLSAVNVKHCHGSMAVTVTANNFKISYSGDCRPSTDFAEIGRGSDVLIHEATFENDMPDEADAKKHSTVGEAISVAKAMKAKLCVLTHFSQRYPTMPVCHEDEEMPIVVAFDYMRLRMGSVPRLVAKQEALRKAYVKRKLDG